MIATVHIPQNVMMQHIMWNVVDIVSTKKDPIIQVRKLEVRLCVKLMTEK